MASRVLVLVGTRRGAFVVEGDEPRRRWEVRGPFCDARPVNHVVAGPAAGTIYAGGGDSWLGATVWRSDDLGASWQGSAEGLAYGDGEERIKQVWSLAATGGGLYAGVEPAGLFRSDDGGVAWRHVEALRAHPSRPSWMPGGGGLILHGIVPHPGDADRLWVAISAAGVFHSADGGLTWEPRNRGTLAWSPDRGEHHPEHGQCVHCLVMAPGTPDRLYQQNHLGAYRSEDGGRSWERIDSGLPSSFGFAAAAHPRDPATLYLVPLSGDQGRYMPGRAAAVWRTRDGGDSWQALRAGLPQENVFFGVLRQAMATDPLEPAGVYLGTNTGSLYASADEGDSWSCIAEHLPGICSVETTVVEG
jgi:photosystem II stability/assembly factor-like uncharacterized protein